MAVKKVFWYEMKKMNEGKTGKRFSDGIFLYNFKTKKRREP